MNDLLEKIKEEGDFYSWNYKGFDCYIKFADDNSVHKVFSLPKLEINSKDFKAFRTYRIG